jgi:SAM-dependent methyltransferase
MSWKPWFENNRMWETMSDFLFSPERWEAATKEVDGLIKTLDLQPKAHILDLCCGPGRHSIDLARRGFKITGVDRNTQYLTIAKDKAAWEGLEIEFIEKDMRRFVRPDTFEAVLSMFTSFGYFEDDDDDRIVVENVYRSLKPGGKFVIDLIGKEVLARIFQPRDWDEKDDLIVLEERKPSPDWSYMISRWIIFKGGNKEEFELRLKMFSATELSALLISAGFSTVDVYGDVNGAAYDNTAKRLIAVAQK